METPISETNFCAASIARSDAVSVSTIFRDSIPIFARLGLSFCSGNRLKYSELVNSLLGKAVEICTGKSG